MEERQLKRSLRTTSISEKRVGMMASKDTAITSKISQKQKNE
jgi:hypothetical protein